MQNKLNERMDEHVCMFDLSRRNEEIDGVEKFRVKMPIVKALSNDESTSGP